jgi:hypothetical protein
MSTHRSASLRAARLLAAAVLVLPAALGAQTRNPGFTIEQILSPAFPYGLGAVQALRAHGTHVRAFVLPDETHYFMRFSSQVAAHRAIDQFFDEMLIKKRAATEQGVQR